MVFTEIRNVEISRSVKGQPPDIRDIQYIAPDHEWSDIAVRADYPNRRCFPDIQNTLWVNGNRVGLIERRGCGFPRCYCSAENACARHRRDRPVGGYFSDDICP